MSTDLHPCPCPLCVEIRSSSCDEMDAWLIERYGIEWPQQSRVINPLGMGTIPTVDADGSTHG